MCMNYVLHWPEIPSRINEINLKKGPILLLILLKINPPVEPAYYGINDLSKCLCKGFKLTTINVSRNKKYSNMI